MKQFLGGTVDLHKVMKIMKCYTITFNPLRLKENHKQVRFIKTSAPELLPFFEFPEFDEEFIKKFMIEIPNIFQCAVNLNVDLDGIEDSRLFIFF